MKIIEVITRKITYNMSKFKQKQCILLSDMKCLRYSKTPVFKHARLAHSHFHFQPKSCLYLVKVTFFLPKKKKEFRMKRVIKMNSFIDWIYCFFTPPSHLYVTLDKSTFLLFCWHWFHLCLLDCITIIISDLKQVTTNFRVIFH